MSLTCISCKLIFTASDLHQVHYKSDWHRYNLKRRLVELPPLSKAAFEIRAAAFEEGTKEKEKLDLKCNTCNKRFSSENSMKSHMKSKKHIDLETNVRIVGSKPFMGDPKVLQDSKSIHKITMDDVMINDNEDDDWDDDDSDWESASEDEEEGLTKIVVDSCDCLFCEHQSDTVENNLRHMTEAHSFFIPDLEYCCDIDSLIAYLAGKIRVGHMCLWCDTKGKEFKDAKAVLKHMFDKGHYKMLYEGDTLVEYADFYDYSSCSDKVECFDEESIDEALDKSGFELVLPSGATIGHRSLSLYFKQNLKSKSDVALPKVKKLLQHYKALGYTGATGPAAVKAKRDIVFMQRLRDRHNLRLAVKTNKFQPHLRPQVMF